MKHLGINLTKCVQDPYEENYKTLMKETKEINKWRCIPCSSTGRLYIVKMLLLPSLIYRVNKIPIKIQESYFVDIDKWMLSLYGGVGAEDPE